MSNTKSLSPLNPETTALILIDLQKGVASMPVEPLSSDKVIENANKLIDAFHKQHSLVIFVRVSSSPDGKDMLHLQADEPMVRRGKMPNDWAEIVPTLNKQPEDLLITKPQTGAFYGTELDLQLRRRGINTIVLGGIATNYGVEATARDAVERGYNLVFATDVMASMTAQDHEFAVTRIFPRIGRVRKTGEITASLSEK